MPYQQIDRNKFIDLLEHLTEPQFAQVLLRIPAARNQVASGVPHSDRVNALINFAESPIGSGLESIVEAIRQVFPDLPSNKIPYVNSVSTGKIPGSANLPPRNSSFTGRDKQINNLRETLVSEQIAAISGLGGIGKTALAVRYAYVFTDHYDFRFFARADSVTTLAASYRSIAEQLGLSITSSTEDAFVIQSVNYYLSTAIPSVPGKIPFLLILDNADFVAPEIADQVMLPNEMRMITVEELEVFLPHENRGHILLTTRAESLDGSLNISVDNVLSLEEMEPTEAEQLLLKRKYGKTKPPSLDESSAARELAKALGFLPLALEQAAAFVAASKARTFRNYLETYRTQEAEDIHISEQLEKAKPQTGKYNKTVATTWKISLDAVEAMEPASADLMRLCAFVSPDVIPTELVLAARGRVKSIAAFFGNLEGTSIIKQRLTELLVPLMQYSLVSTDNSLITFNIHRLVQAVTRWNMDTQTRRNWITNNVEVLNTTFLSGKFEYWPICEQLIPHVQALAEWIRIDKSHSEPEARLFNQAAFYLDSRGRYTEAEVLFNESLAIVRSCLPENSLQIAVSLNNLSSLYSKQGRYYEAEQAHIEALTIFRSQLPANHPFIATSLNNIGELYRTQGLYDKAKPLITEALFIRRSCLPPNHPEIAGSLNNMALLHYVERRYTEAESLYIEALKILREALPENPTDIAQILGNMGLLYKIQRRYAEAEPYYVEALQILRDCLPFIHLNIAISLNNFALFYYEQGRLIEGKSLLIEALEMAVASVGDAHPFTKTVTDSLEVLRQEQKQRESNMQ